QIGDTSLVAAALTRWRAPSRLGAEASTLLACITPARVSRPWTAPSPPPKSSSTRAKRRSSRPAARRRDGGAARNEAREFGVEGLTGRGFCSLGSTPCDGARVERAADCANGLVVDDRLRGRAEGVGSCGLDRCQVAGRGLMVTGA